MEAQPIKIPGNGIIRLRPIPGHDLKQEVEELAVERAKEEAYVQSLVKMRDSFQPAKHSELIELGRKISELSKDTLIWLTMCMAKQQGTLVQKFFDHYVRTFAADLERKANHLVCNSLLHDLGKRQPTKKHGERDWNIYQVLTDAKANPEKFPNWKAVQSELQRRHNMKSRAAVNTAYERMKKLVEKGEYPLAVSQQQGPSGETTSHGEDLPLASQKNLPTEQAEDAERFCATRLRMSRAEKKQELTKLCVLDEQLGSAWKKVASELGITVTAPVGLVVNRERVRYAVKIKGFGSSKGLLIRAIPGASSLGWDEKEVEPLVMKARQAGFTGDIVGERFSSDDPELCKLYLTTFAWHGTPKKKPHWHRHWLSEIKSLEGGS